MAILLYVLGVLSVLAGAAAVALGLPVKEFSFGNTLIVTGVTGVVGGLIVVGLGAAVAQLQRAIELLGARPLSRAGQPFDSVVRLGNGPGRVPFPPKPKAERREQGAELPPVPPMPAVEPDFAAAPSLHNPDVPLMAEDEAEQLPLSPRESDAPRSIRTLPAAEEEPPMTPPPPRMSPTPFETMWPAAERSPPPPPEPSRADSIPRAPMAVEPEPLEPQEEMQEEAPEEAPVAILKSGVVDGMGYTLYVDGSIEAELPDGTLRFASIHELRTHLEKNA
jgi:hypothetical protein